MNVKIGQGNDIGKNRLSGAKRADKKVLDSSVVCDNCKLTGHTNKSALPYMDILNGIGCMVNQSLK